MKLSTVLLALCFALVPIAAHATAAHHDPLHQVQRAQRHAIPQTATAFVPTPKVDDDSDGLTRNRDECNRGCIDSN
jgi:dihydroxyacetone kinase